MRHLTVQRGLAIAAGATSPAASAEEVIYSATANTWLRWTGSAWMPVQADTVTVFHGSTAGTARPVGAGSVLWVGSVEPTNAITSTDLWLDTSGA